LNVLIGFSLSGSYNFFLLSYSALLACLTGVTIGMLDGTGEREKCLAICFAQKFRPASQQAS
jgi:hypothetical protein